MIEILNVIGATLFIGSFVVFVIAHIFYVAYRADYDDYVWVSTLLIYPTLGLILMLWK